MCCCTKGEYYLAVTILVLTFLFFLFFFLFNKTIKPKNNAKSVLFKKDDETNNGIKDAQKRINSTSRFIIFVLINVFIK